MGNYGFTVIDGDMKYIDPSGAVIDVAEAGSGIMYVNFTLDDSGGEDVYSADKTFAEIAAAIKAGKFVYSSYTGDGLDYYLYPLIMYSGNEIDFGSITLGTDGFLEGFTLFIYADGSIVGQYVHCDLSSLIVES